MMKAEKSLTAIDKIISGIPIDAANLKHIAETGKINGSLLVELRKAMDTYAYEQLKPVKKQVDELLKETEDLRIFIYKIQQTSNEL